MNTIAQRVLLLSGWRRAALAVAIGAVSALALAPFHLFVVCFVTFPVLVWLLDGAVGATPGRAAGALWSAFRIGWWFGLGYFTAGLWWLANALLVEAPEFAWAIPLAVIGLPAVLALFYGAACAAARALWSDGLGRIAALAAAFGVAEWLRSFVLTGFPWNAIGYALMPVPVMMQSAVLGGIFAISAAAVFMFALPAQLAARRLPAAAAMALCVALMAGHVGFGMWHMSAAANIGSVGEDAPVLRLVQPSVSQEQKMDDAARVATFEKLLDLTALGPELATTEDGLEMLGEAAPPDVVIWPETAVPFLLTRNADALTAIGDTLAPEQSLLAGAVREAAADTEDAGRYYNSVMAVTTDGVIADAADKVHLVPFGEYLPFAALLERVGLRAIAAADRGYSAAPARQLVAMPGGITFLPLICYEAIFPHLAAIPDDASVDAIVNVTNDAWFGRTPGPWQHMHMARLRAVETGVPLVRVANNGISAVVDPFGRTVARVGHDVRAVADVALPEPIQPWYQEAQRLNNFWLLIAVLSAMALIGRLWTRSFGRFWSRND